MTKLNASRLSLTASVIALTAAFGTPAFAQSASTPPITPATPPDQAPGTPCPPGVTGANGVCVSGEVQTESGVPANPNNANAIIVTGSRIKRPNLESPVPITSISQQELTNQGQVSVGDALNDLPALRTTFSQQSSGRFIGTAGQNFLDLRGLGTIGNSFAPRTLVLVNGRRMITGSPGDFIPDVDNIPQDLIDRIDIVTGGESAVYGSDAVAGVVNFVLKNDFDGWRVRGQGGESTYGDRPVEFVSTTYGKNFADGRGNIAVNLEYTHAGELRFEDRPGRFAHPCGFEPNNADNGGVDDPTTASGDSTNGVPDNLFLCNLRNPFITTGGQVALLTFSGRGLAFDPNGNLLVTPPCDTSFIATGGTCQSSNPLVGATIDETGDLAVGRDRYSAALIGHFDISDALKPFVESWFVHQKVHQEGQPSFMQGNVSDFFAPVAVPNLTCNNGFLTQQNIGVLQGIGFCDQLDAQGNPILDANGNPILDPNAVIPMDRFNVDMGARREIDTRDTFRIVTGITGDFNEDWHYELSVNYGHTSADNAQHNDLLLRNPDGTPAGFALAIDAVSVLNGQIVAPGTPGSTIMCRSTITDPTNGCVPIDLFGEGQPSPEAVTFSNTTSHLFQSASELDFLGYVSGDTSQWINLPGGPIGFSVGFEHRKETAESHADPVSAAGGTFFNAFSRFDPPPFKVTEFYGELSAPILKDLPFAHELTVSGAARRSHYNTSAGNTFAWNVNGIFAPVADLRFRANYSKSVRAPSLSDLFSPPSQNFNFLKDPCDALNIGTNPQFATNCAALGVPTTVTADSPCASAAHPVGSPFVNCVARNQTIQFLSSGNNQLTPEVGKSLTVGGVLTPRWVPGFSFSVDYYRINITNVISSLSAQTILNSCFGTPLPNNFCGLIFPRDANGLFAVPALISAGVNFAKVRARGIDFDLSYRHRVGPGRLDLRGIATYVLERTNFIDPQNPNLANRVLSELGEPKFSGTLITGYTLGHFDLRYTLRYIGSMTVFAFEDTHSFPGACLPSGACPPFNSDIADRTDTGATWYHDVRLGYTINKYNFYVGVDNVFNRLPPLGLTGSGQGSGIFTNTGRFVYAGATLDLQ
jgi:outer membrane receptor protein involved in Fe transport